MRGRVCVGVYLDRAVAQVNVLGMISNFTRRLIQIEKLLEANS